MGIGALTKSLVRRPLYIYYWVRTKDGGRRVGRGQVRQFTEGHMKKFSLNDSLILKPCSV